MKYQNTQLYMECHLVAIWNAARFFGMEHKIPKIGTEEYDKWCLKYACKSGSCIGLKKEFKRLGLKRVEGKWNFDWIKNNLPVVLSIYPPKQRPHAILAVKEQFGGFVVANFGGGVIQWYSYEKLYEMKINNPCFNPEAIKKRK